jgi:hypothetical protein
MTENRFWLFSKAGKAVQEVDSLAARLYEEFGSASDLL